MRAVRQRYGGQAGFTLVEVLVIVLLLGILVAIVVASYGYSQMKALEMADRANLRTLRHAVQAFRAESPDASFPETLQDLYPGYVQSQGALMVPRTATPYLYDKTTGDVRNPYHPER